MFINSGGAEICPMVLDRDDHTQVIELQTGLEQGVVAKTVRVNLGALRSNNRWYIFSMTAKFPVRRQKVLFFNIIPNWVYVAPVILFDSYAKSYEFAARALGAAHARESVEETYFVSHN